MTIADYTRALRKLADAVERVGVKGKLPQTPGVKPLLQGEAAVGAAIMWGYIRDLLTMGDKEYFGRGELLVLLDIINEDPNICLPNTFHILNDLTNDAESSTE